jgi:hypothetical protein
VIPFEDPLPVDLTQKNDRIQIQKMLRAGTLQAGQDDAFTKYYATYALARWTVPENFTELPEYRKDLENELRLSKQGQVHDMLAQMVLNFMTKLAKGNHPPVLRFNAMLTIARLNAVDSPTASRPTIASPDALSVLLEALDDQNQLDACKVAALLGLVRHAQLRKASEPSQTGMGNPQIRGQVIDRMRTLATTKAVPKRDPGGHAWMRALAIDVLANLGVAGNQGEIATTLADITAEDPGSPIARDAAAKALGYLNYNGVAGLDPMPLNVALTAMASKACDAELKRYEQAKEKKQKGQTGGYGAGYGGPMGSMGMEDGYGLEEMDDYEEGGGYGMYPGMGMSGQKTEGMISRRRLKNDLGAILIGLHGPDRKTGVGNINAASQEYAEKVIKQIKDLVNDMDDEELDDEGLLEKITEAKSEFERLVQQPEAPADAVAGAAAG